MILTGTLRCPIARSNGLNPLWSTRSREAPRSNNISASSAVPPQANPKGVRPLLSGWSINK